MSRTAIIPKDLGRRYACPVCAYEYDPARGDALHGVHPGTPFAQLPPGWRCPWCGAPKDRFVPEDCMR
jgi:rubredoxin